MAAHDAVEAMPIFRGIRRESHNWDRLLRKIVYKIIAKSSSAPVQQRRPSSQACGIC